MPGQANTVKNWRLPDLSVHSQLQFRTDNWCFSYSTQPEKFLPTAGFLSALRVWLREKIWAKPSHRPPSIKAHISRRVFTSKTLPKWHRNPLGLQSTQLWSRWGSCDQAHDPLLCCTSSGPQGITRGCIQPRKLVALSSVNFETLYTPTCFCSQPSACSWNAALCRECSIISSCRSVLPCAFPQNHSAAHSHMASSLLELFPSLSAFACMARLLAAGSRDYTWSYDIWYDILYYINYYILVIGTAFKQYSIYLLSEWNDNWSGYQTFKFLF